MSEFSGLNDFLHRDIKKGVKYGKLLPDSKCEATYLGEGDTYFSMKSIKDSIYNNHYQVKDLAPQLQKETLKATIGSDYNFLYHHFQYTADASDQLLRSPACSWYDRYNGIDCKSYSIFAGCLLLQQGIIFYIRKIKQPSLNSSSFSHVYIVVPKDQLKGDLKKGYYVIDATQHSNTEALYTDKEDVFMNKLPHFGLKSPAISGALGAPGNVSQEARQGFYDFIKFLGDVGVFPEMLTEARTQFDVMVSQGLNPSFSLQNTQGFVLGTTLYNYTTSIPGNRSANSYISPIYLAIQASGLNSANRSNGNPPTTEAELGAEIAQVAAGLLEGDFFKDTIGAVLGNGFRLGCWNTATNPREGERLSKLDAKKILILSGLTQGQGATQQNWNKFILLTHAYSAGLLHIASNTGYAKCSRDGWKAAAAGMKGFFNEISSILKSRLIETGGNLVAQVAGNNPIFVNANNPGFTGANALPSKWKLENPPLVQIPVHILTLGSRPVYIDPPSVGSNSSQGNTTTTTTTTTTTPRPTRPGNTTPRPNYTTSTGVSSNQSQFGASPVVILLVVSAIAGTYLYNKNKNQ